MKVGKIIVDTVSVVSGCAVLFLTVSHFGTPPMLHNAWEVIGWVSGLVAWLGLVFGVPGLLELISEYENDIAELKSSLELARSTSHDTKEAK